jgi:hypothetical protein
MKVELSDGEIVDKLTILWIKEDMIEDKEKLINIRNEISEISPCLEEMNLEPTSLYVTRLHDVNQKLWKIEDDIREKERLQEFDEEFVSLARSVYVVNDLRANLKKQINILTGSDLIEEKSYKEYKQ